MNKQRKEELYDEYEKLHNNSILRNRRFSSKFLKFYIFLFIMTIFVIVCNGPSLENIVLLLVFAFCIGMSVYNKKKLSPDVTFKTEYLEDSQNEKAESVDNAESMDNKEYIDFYSEDYIDNENEEMDMNNNDNNFRNL